MTKSEVEKKIDSLGDIYESAKDAVHNSMNPDSSEMTAVLTAIADMRNIAATALQDIIHALDTKKLNDLDKLSLMAINNQDIRQSTALVEAKNDPRGGLVTMGVDANTIQQIILNQDQYLVSLYVINKKQFSEY